MTASPTRKKYPVWFSLVFLLIPLLFFLLTEGVLRVIDFGKDYPVFTKEYENYPDYLFFNPRLPGKYFSAISQHPGVIADGFLAEKPTNSFRVFLLGESSAAGWPYVPNASISRRVKHFVQKLYPQISVEVINMGVSAVNTFFIRDILPDVLRQKPDLLLIYTGHNEYYGALGVGSTQSFLPGRRLTNLYLGLKKFRTVQFLEHLIRSVQGSVSNSDKSGANGGNETLMSRMIGNSTIPLNSAVYQNGLTQFEGNMEDIIQMCHEEKVPLLIGKIASNLSGMEPFFTSGTEAMRAKELFRTAGNVLSEGKKDSALTLFTLAKDTDPLRFRAPSAVNSILEKLGTHYGVPLISLDSLLNTADPTGVTGTALMVDHLHPNAKGYDLIAQSFVRAMVHYNYLPAAKSVPDLVSSLETFSQQQFISDLDSVIADIRIRILTGAYPFVPKGTPNNKLHSFKMKNRVDSLAAQIVDGVLAWEEGHNRLFLQYLSELNYLAAQKEIDVLIADRPMNVINYRNAALSFAAVKQFDLALPYFIGTDNLEPDATSSKAIGSILLTKNDFSGAKIYLQKSIGYNSSDPTVWYNLAGAYAQLGEYEKALPAVNECLRLRPAYPQALSLKLQLEAK